MWSSIVARAALATSAEGPSSGTAASAIARQVVRRYARRHDGGGGSGKGEAPTTAAAKQPPPPPPTLHERPPTVAANAIAAAAAARARAAEAAAAAAAGAASSSSSSLPFDAARASAPPRVHRLIGDPRTGVADDTTERSPAAAASNDIAVELLWEQEKPGGVEWYRYTPFHRQQPHMRRDARLSDHSRNLMYLLRCAYPSRWTVEALARKFRVRRQRVLAVLALKELEAQALEDGRLMGGGGGGAVSSGAVFGKKPVAAPGQPTSTDNSPALARGLRAYCMTVDLADLRLHVGTREPHDLADAAAATAAQAQGGGKKGSGQQQQQQQRLDNEWAWARHGRTGKDAYPPSLGADPAADLARVAPAQAATAQRLHAALLSLLQQHGYSADRLLAGLLAQVDAAEAHYEAHVKGSALERALELGWRAAEAERDAERLVCAAAERAAREAADPWAALAGGGGGGGAAAAADGGGGGGEAAAAAGGEAQGGDDDSSGSGSGSTATAASGGGLFDFAAQRAALRAAVGALRPLLANAGPRAEREAAALAAELSALLGRAAAEGEGKEEKEEKDGDGEDADAPLRAAAAAAAPDTLARAFNALPLGQRQALLERAPAARAALDLRGADLTAVVNPFGSGSGGGGAGAGAGGGSYAALSLPFSLSGAAAAVDDGDNGGSSGGSGSGNSGGGGATSYALGRWPGQVRPLVDVWGYEEVGAGAAAAGGADGALPGAGPPADPDALFAALLGPTPGVGCGAGGSGSGNGGGASGALLALERAVADLERCASALGIQASGGASLSSSSGAGGGSSSPHDGLGSLDDFLAGGGGAQEEQRRQQMKQGKGEGGAGAAPATLPTCADVLALREDLHTYQHIDWIYDRAVDHQAAELVAAAATERAAALGGGGGGSGGSSAAAAASKLLAAPPRRVSETPGAWDTPPLPAKQQQRMLRILRALDPSAAERLMYLEALSREDRAAGAAAALGGLSAENALRRAARMRAQVTRVLRHMDGQVHGGKAGGGDSKEEGEEEEGQGEPQEAAAAATAAAATTTTALPPTPADLPDSAPASARAPLELIAAFIESAVVGRQFHRGSGERHVALVPTFPSFDGRPLSEASGEAAESELSAAAREAAKREDDSMWRDFRARLLHNLGVSGADLWDVRGRARPQRPAEGWSMVVHPVGAKEGEAAGAKRRSIDPRAGPGAPAAGAGRAAASAPYVSEPGGALRPLSGDEAVLEKRRTPRRRRRWPL